MIKEILDYWKEAKETKKLKEELKIKLEVFVLI